MSSVYRDYKRTATVQQKRRRVARRHGLLVMTLVLIGLFGGLLAYLRGQQAQTPPAPVSDIGAPTQSGSVPETAPSTGTPTPSPATPVVPVRKTTAPALRSEEEAALFKPKYEFYTELPKRQIDVYIVHPDGTRTPLKPPPRVAPAPAPRKTAPRKPSTATPAVATLNRSNAARTMAVRSTSTTSAPARTAAAHTVAAEPPRITNIAARTP